jgi:hypothetical protein
MQLIVLFRVFRVLRGSTAEFGIKPMPASADYFENSPKVFWNPAENKPTAIDVRVSSISGCS